ncbi:hypothetical protein ACN28S_00180 [Cystobacter fuscus]
MATNPVNEQTTQAATGEPAPQATCPMKALREAPRCPALLDKENPEFLAHAYATYADLRAQAPVVRTSFAHNFADAVLPGARSGRSPEATRPRSASS